MATKKLLVDPSKYKPVGSALLAKKNDNAGLLKELARGKASPGSLKATAALSSAQLSKWPKSR